MLPETVIVDVGELLFRLSATVAYRQGLPLVVYDTPDSPANVNVDEYIEMVVDSLVSHDHAIESLQQLIKMALDERSFKIDERICDILEAMGILIHQQLATLRLYEPNDGPLHYFYTGRGDDWIALARFSRSMADNITQSVNTPFRW
jgi:hypothetical protein